MWPDSDSDLDAAHRRDDDASEDASEDSDSESDVSPITYGELLSEDESTVVITFDIDLERRCCRSKITTDADVLLQQTGVEVGSNGWPTEPSSGSCTIELYSFHIAEDSHIAEEPSLSVCVDGPLTCPVPGCPLTDTYLLNAYFLLAHVREHHATLLAAYINEVCRSRALSVAL